MNISRTGSRGFKAGILTIVMATVLSQGCDNKNIVVIPSSPSTEPTMEDPITPEPTQNIVTASPTNTPTASSTEVVTPSPTATPSGPDEFGLPPDMRDNTVDIEDDVWGSVFEVDGIPKVILVPSYPTLKDDNGEFYSILNNLLSGEYICDINEYNRVLKMGTYFKDGETVKLILSGDLKMLLSYLEIDPNNSDKVKPSDFVGMKTLGEVEDILKRMVNKENLYIDQGQPTELPDRPDSLISKKNDDMLLNSIANNEEIDNLTIEYENGEKSELDVILDNDTYESRDLYSGISTKDKDFLNTISKGRKIKNMYYSLLYNTRTGMQDVSGDPQRKKMTKYYREAKSVRNLRLLYQVCVPTNVWYIALDPKKLCNDIHNGVYDAILDDNPLVLKKV